MLDLVTQFVLRRDGRDVRLRFRGGLLEHWSVWTRRAVEAVLRRIQTAVEANRVDGELLAWETRVTDSNAAFFDAAHQFAGGIPGCHELLRRQGLLEGTWCLNPNEMLSPGQAEEIDRVYAAYPDAQ